MKKRDIDDKISQWSIVIFLIFITSYILFILVVGIANSI